MTDLLDHLVEGHGGLKRWHELQTVTAHLAQGGVRWALKGQLVLIEPLLVSIDLSALTFP